MNLGDLVGPLTGGLFDGNWNFVGSGKSDNGQQHPFVQQVARNLGHNLYGEGVGNYVDQKFLGDVPVNPNAPNDTLNSPQNQALQKMLQGWLQTK